ncbi:hypothetical protein PVIIG_05207 [Plasmodium vivax India VII]|uniref:Variable surface protein n=1 Tax=Plasmodium vivax India VII TaxID=1077284 RepID=A0A0J9S3C3_PLAVI|nr:hypothetical protein PVIIG_05207 [Plasmodium vivax India VII]
MEDGNSKYDVLCDNFLLNGSNEDIKNYSQFCKKFMRNLGHTPGESKNYEFTPARCNILYYWIYNSIHKENKTSNILQKFIDEYNSYMDGIGNNKRCYHFLYDKIYEPINVTLLDIFQDNMQNIKNKLIHEFESTKLSFRTFVCECVKIYKNMNKLYCPNGNKPSEKHRTTCVKLDNFKESYVFFYNNIRDLYPRIPSLDDNDNVFRAKCFPDEKDTLLRTDEDGTQDPSLESGLSARAGDRDRELTDGLHETNEMVDNSMKKNITTTIGTVAGASSLLALLYRVNTIFHENIHKILYIYT